MLNDSTAGAIRLIAARSAATPRAYVLAILCATMMLNFLDRQIFSILLESIKHDLAVSDTAMGLLTGGAFAVVYVIAGIPLARAADVGMRRSILAGCLLVWSAMTFTCGLAANYTQLIFSRMGVAVGEAGAHPTTYSIVSDLYPPKVRPGVIGILYFWSAVGIGGSMFVGGYLNQLVGWRMTLMLVALPGLLLAVLVRLTVREPARVNAPTERDRGLGQAVATLSGIRTFRCLVAFSAFTGLAGYGILSWAPTFLIRVHHMPVVQVGLLMGLAAGCGSGIGAFTGGRISNRLAAQGDRGMLLFCASVALMATPLQLLFLHLDSKVGALTCFAVGTFLMAMFQPAYYAVALSVVPSRTRGLATMSLTMAQNLGGIAVGSIMGGVFNDLLTPHFGASAIRYSLTALLSGLLAAAATALLATRYVEADCDRLRSGTP